jgi:cyclophilin family peptidyl-prolyl cis-trans isomerase
MKLMTRTVQFFLLFVLLTAAACQDKYPDLEDGLYAEIITNKGTMVANLEYDKVPVTVANFVALAEGKHPMVKEEFKDKKYYNGLTFHRVMDKFMIQGGDPTASGSGEPGYKFPDEFSPDLKHDKAGILSMANPGPNSNGSQFFIMEVPYPSLDNRHAVFGELVMGLDVQDSISNVKVAAGNKPVDDVVIQEINIIRKGAKAKAFDAPKVFKEEMPLIAQRQQEIKDNLKKVAQEKAKVAQAAFLKNNEKLEGRVLNLPSGVAMIFTNEGDGEKPNSTEEVLVHCAGYFENGELFYTTWKEVAEKNGKFDERTAQQNGYQPFPMIYNESAGLVPGFREAMLNMKVGDKARVFIPSFLGYGEAGRGSIPPNTNLIFDLEIVGIAGK